mmetsp:Transcript_19321/g.27777  ORF Transcript_19321/g.27777 Transcript_19321/m.27777 type:complete len:508 (-) Transcript_19321:109-1632(-)|eukprot:CAMPEP_0185025286 /NCGR_PEP_ID=MMETSP1103-20130426/8301_1 /TAXON_ID=36769 /ORGANISM="Paraphysomonas bandaiensis, Strain Caron Lab Isolate" /LENGTH=507 /DNA_ID=CAMNT_0027558449 /DNA_START=60 /DNA_END=1583 /DNA_ORIENTATION=+
MILHLTILSYALCIYETQAFRWHVNDDMSDTGRVLTLSERYMFASGDGPLLLEQGESYIDIETKLLVTSRDNVSSHFEYAVYATDFEHHADSFGLCGESASEYSWATNALIRTVPTQYTSTVKNPTTGANEYHWTAKIRRKYTVNVESWHNVAFQLCSYQGRILSAELTGTVSFKNPYGYIPAELYGLLPFEGARAVAFILFTGYFLYYYLRYQESVLVLHKAIFGVLLVAAAEACMWFAAYLTINLTGHPYCCPFPPVVVAALIMQIFRQTLSRTLLLVVSLGYGIVRPKLLNAEWIAVTAVTLLYFGIATTYEVASIVSLDVHPDEAPRSAGMLVPSMLIDLLFLMWIYLALTSTIRILTEFQQTHKLDMYNRLFSTIGLFSILFIVVSVLMSLRTTGYVSFPWQWDWLQQVSWEILNFSVLAAVCVICRPSDTSMLLSYAAQLPTEDPDDYDEDVVPDINGAADDMESRKQRSSGSRIRNDNDYSLPSADDEEFGLDHVENDRL